MNVTCHTQASWLTHSDPFPGRRRQRVHESIAHGSRPGEAEEFGGEDFDKGLGKVREKDFDKDLGKVRDKVLGKVFWG
jgi:hypothetical protein